MRQTVLINLFVVSDKVALIRVDDASFVPRSDPELAPAWRAVVIFTRGPVSKFELLDRHGRAIDQTGAQASVPTVPVTTVNPRHLPAAVCSLGACGLPGVGSQWELVADRAPTRGRDAPPEVLFSLRTRVVRIPQRTCGLLRRDPSRRPKRGAHGAKPTGPHAEHPGRRLQEATSTAGQITAKRVGNAWLIVHGPNQRQRTALLNNIDVAGTAIEH
jgi:hypothetical protein